MTHGQWLELMRFPPQWSDWGMIPEELARIQVANYEDGHEAGAEHDRHGAFQWWLRQSPSSETLTKLARLSWLDPDPLMGAYVRERIESQCGQNSEVLQALACEYKA